MTLAERILAKTPLPTHLDSVTIRARVAQQIREQAFFSAQMTLGGYLKDLQRLLAAYADGQMDASQVRIRARAKLDELGFSTVATGLQDPRSPARLNLILKTNEQMAAGMAQRDLGADPLLLKAFPAWELVSGGYRRVHRTDWPRRWQAAGDAVAWRGALKGKRMVALKTSPIWAALGEGAGGFKDTLGNPYPPFAFGSSYEWSELSILEAQDLGLVPKPDSALNKRDTHGHFAETEGEPCTHGGGKTEDEKDEKATRQHQKVLAAIVKGFKGPCAKEDAIELLSKEFSIESKNGHFDFGLLALGHYRDGHRRLNADPMRLEELPYAVHLLKTADGYECAVGMNDERVYPDKNGKYPRGSRFKYTGKVGKRTFVVYPYCDTGKVTGWFFLKRRRDS